MGMRQEAIEKVKKDSFEHGSPQEVLQRLLLAWIEYDEGAAERILAENKGTKGCYEHIQSRARELHQNSVNAAPEQEVAWMLDYYGIEDNAAHALRRMSGKRTPWRVSTSTRCLDEEARR